MSPLSILALVAACNRAPEGPPPENHLTIVHQGRMDGEIEPCG